MQAIYRDDTAGDLVRMDDEAAYKEFCDRMLADEEVAYIKVQRIIPTGVWRRRLTKKSRRKQQRYF